VNPDVSFSYSGFVLVILILFSNNCLIEIYIKKAKYLLVFRPDEAFLTLENI